MMDLIVLKHQIVFSLKQISVTSPSESTRSLLNLKLKLSSKHAMLNISEYESSRDTDGLRTRNTTGVANTCRIERPHDLVTKSKNCKRKILRKLTENLRFLSLAYEG